MLAENLLGRPELADCVCRVGTFRDRGRVECRERTRISWDNPNYIFLHFRFDGCICDDPTCNKCDCIIFRLRNNAKPIMFVIETKGGNPSFSEAKKQIEYCIDTMIELLPNPKTQFKIVPVLCAGRITTFMKEVSLSNKVKIFGEKSPINLRRHPDDINELC